MGRRILIAGLLLLAACGGDPAGDLSGADLFTDLGCFACHTDTDTDRAPTLNGIWGSEVLLEDGRTVTVDEAYVRRSIFDPRADIVGGFDTIMPPFPLSESEIDRLVDYVRSLG